MIVLWVTRMQKWEYCKITVWHNKPLKATATFYNLDGRTINDITQNIVDEMSIREVFAKYVAKLGLEGWELVAVANVSNSPEFVLYFKRPMQ